MWWAKGYILYINFCFGLKPIHLCFDISSEMHQVGWFTFNMSSGKDQTGDSGASGILLRLLGSSCESALFLLSSRSISFFWYSVPKAGRRNEAAGPKRKQCSIVNVSGGDSQVWCCKEQYCIGTWNVRSMNQGKLDVVKQMASMNINILGNQWTKLQYFSHLIQRADSLEKTLMLRDWQQKEKRAAEDEMVR